MQLDIAAKRLGEVVVDPAQWQSVMEDVCAAAGVTGALLLQSDVRTPDVPRTASVNDLVNTYFQNDWHTRDTRVEKGVPLILGGMPVIDDADIFSSHDEWRADAMYNEHFFPQGFPCFTVVAFWAGSAMWGFSFQHATRDGLRSAKEKEILGGLSRQLTEAATLSTAVGRATLSSATNALDAIQKAAVAIDRTGFVLDVNASAQAMFDGSFNLRKGRLWSTDPHAQTQLALLFERMNASSDLQAFPADPIVVRRRLQPPVVIHVLPVHGGARSPFLGARAILTLTSVVPRPFPNEVLLSRVFDLTPAEARLASALAQGMPVAEAARSLGIAELTARTQLKAIFSKTGVHRQPELVAVLAQL